MKKLVFFFIVLISLVVIVGCNNSRKNVTRFDSESSSEYNKPDSGITITTINKNEDSDDEPLAAEPILEEKEDDEDLPPVAFAITSFNGDTVESKKGYHLIEGSTPRNTTKIMVNDYTLNKYEPGTTNWRYIAAVSLGTLKQGNNEFTVKALDEEDKPVGSKKFTIVYKGEESGSLVGTGSPLSLAFAFTAISMMALQRRKRKA